MAAGCTQAPENKAPEFDAVAMAKTVVSRDLKDPASAQWGEIKATKFHEGYVACGTVNAKNGFGGYTGDAQFRAAFTKDGEGTADVADDPRYGILVAAGCSIIFEIAARNSDSSKWPAEKKELLERVTKSTQELASKVVNQGR